MNRNGQLLGVSTAGVMKWIRTLGTSLCHKIEPSSEDEVIVMEVDEFWYFLKKPMTVIDKDSLTGKSVIVIIKPSGLTKR